MKNTSYRPDVYLHIGLPKTATTSLQINVFPKLSEFVNYIGVNQPRSLKQDSIYNELVSLIKTQSFSYDSNSLSICKKITDRIYKKNKAIFLSEEMFSIDNGGVVWQEKLKRLGHILNNLKVTIIVTTREPVKATYSLYAELYPEIKREHPTFNDFFFKSNQALIYRYDKLHSILCDSFTNKTIRYIPFESITKRVDAKQFIDEVLDWPTFYKIPVVNAKKKSTRGAETSSPRVRDLIPYKLQPRILKYFSLIMNFRVGLLKSYIPLYSSKDEMKMRMVLVESNNLLKIVSGIDYNDFYLK